MKQNITEKKECALFWDANPCNLKFETSKDLIMFMFEKEPYLRSLFKKEYFSSHLILEVGCGQGGDFFCYENLLDQNSKSVCLDYSLQSLQMFKQSLNGYKNKPLLINGDAENLSFSDNTFNFVYCSGVLHHTPDTQKGINEIHRVVKYGEKVVFMLYRLTSPKGLVVAGIRLLSKAVDLLMRQDKFIYKHFFTKGVRSSAYWGSAFEELFGVPIMKMFTYSQIKQMFTNYRFVKIYAVSSGFKQIAVTSPWFIKPFLMSLANYFDSRCNRFGFYWIIEAQK